MATEDCSSNLPLDQKKQRLQEEMSSLRCTLKSPRARDCSRNISCVNCARRHAKFICDPAWIKAKEGKSDPKYSMVVCTSSSRKDIRGFGVILLQTFRAWPVSDTSCRFIGGVIDSGNQQMFVTRCLSRRLQLKCVGYTKMSLNRFASASTQECKKRHVIELKFRSQLNTDAYKIEATKISVICQDISTLTRGSVFVAGME